MASTPDDGPEDDISPHINGVAGDAYLEGDGSVTFTLDFVSAISAFANAFGHYEVAADTRLGFFMIQDGFDQFGALPDDLSFRAPGSDDPATLDAGLPPILFGDSRGAFDGAVIFHTFSTPNPADIVQVLSGTSKAGWKCRWASRTCPPRRATATTRTWSFPSGPTPTDCSSSRGSLFGHAREYGLSHRRRAAFLAPSRRR